MGIFFNAPEIFKCLSLRFPKKDLRPTSTAELRFAKVFATELEWLFFEADQITLLAVMLRCEIDKDFNAVILGRDLDRKFRAIHIIV